MANVQLVHSQRIGAKTAPITYTEARRGCYIWTKTGRTTIKEGIEQAYFRCSGCISAKQRDSRIKATIFSLKFNLTAMTWIGDVDQYEHICVPKNINEVTGTNARRSIQAELAAGTQETGAQARVRIDRRLVQEFGCLPDQDFNVIRHAAVGNKNATEEALYRAKCKNCPRITTFEEFMTEENRSMRLTLRGAELGHVHFGENLLLYGDSDMLIFSSPGQLRLLHSCSNIISDGTFKYAPIGVMQIYRIFGLIRQLHATPLVTVLMKRKTAVLYKLMWEKVRDALLELRVVNSISFANFDAEIGAYSTFAEVFPGVSVKLCSFHVKQGLYRKVQSLGLSQNYETNEDLQKFVRMLGALQITPIVEWPPCLELLRTKIDDGPFDQDLAGMLEELLVYFENTWLSRGEIFCLFGYTGPRTTNHAESYHGKQRLHFSINAKLGHWAVGYRQLTHTEELDAYDVFEGRQPPRRQRTDCMEITTAILELKDRLLEFLSSDDGLLQGERYARKMDRYLSRIGRLMGINSLEFREVMQEDNDDEEDAQEAAVRHDEGEGGAREFPEEEAYPNVVFDAELNVYRRV